MVVSCVDVVLKYVTEAYVGWTCGKSVCVFNEKIFQACSHGVKEVVILDGGKEKYAEVFWDLRTEHQLLRDLGGPEVYWEHTG